MIVREARYLDDLGRPGDAMLRSCLKEFQGQQARLGRLKDYFERRHPINGRTRRRGLPNNRLAHDLPGYIAGTAASYLTGSPVQYESGQRAALDALIACYEQADADSVDCELAMDAAVYGRAVELCYADEQAQRRIVQADPMNAFVVYDSCASHKPLFGVVISASINERGERTGLRVMVYTQTQSLCYEGKSLYTLSLMSVEEHYFGGVPLVEYWNNAKETGDFEGVLPLIDAYDALQSDRVNDKQQFTDAVLVLYGVAGVQDENGQSATQRLREEKTLCMPDGDARVEFLTKQLSESDTEVLKESLRQDIHKLCFVPDFTEKDFAGNQSGEAMRYKLFGLNRLIRIKERWFSEGLRARMRLMAAFLAMKGGEELASGDVKIRFTHALEGNTQEQTKEG